VVLIISAILLSANPQSLPSRTPLAVEEQKVSGSCMGCSGTVGSLHCPMAEADAPSAVLDTACWSAISKLLDARSLVHMQLVSRQTRDASSQDFVWRSVEPESAGGIEIN
jgi:hypothetical protein